ncbi:MAG TPA: hypothetical protein VLB44_03010 [Kofleriaceae bacterium]|nr:hypothetical protein [Kofleriaceae bacterium]
MRSLRVALIAVAVLVLALGGCRKTSHRSPPGEQECQSYRDKLFSFMPAEERAAMTQLGLGKQTPKELEICQQRMHSDEIGCVLKAATLDEALACKSAVDDRPAEVKRTPEECTAYSDHVKKLATENESGEAIGPPFTPFMASLFARECSRWLTKQRYDCVMKAPSAMGLMQCPP